MTSPHWLAAVLHHVPYPSTSSSGPGGFWALTPVDPIRAISILPPPRRVFASRGATWNIKMLWWPIHPHARFLVITTITSLPSAEDLSSHLRSLGGQPLFPFFFFFIHIHITPGAYHSFLNKKKNPEACLCWKPLVTTTKALFGKPCLFAIMKLCHFPRPRGHWHSLDTSIIL